MADNQAAIQQTADRAELLHDLKRICWEIGCSGVSKDCPGDPMCGILRNLILGVRTKLEQGMES